MSLRITAKDINGVYNIIPTPATENAASYKELDTINYEVTENLIKMLVSNGVDGILTNGTLGEGATLTEEEHINFAKKVIETVNNKVPIFIGATTLNTRDTINRGKKIMGMGASGLFLGRPMWCDCDDETTLKFYSDVAEALPDAPIIIYDNHEAFKVKISSKTYGELAKIPNIVASKYVALGPQFLDDVAACGDNIRILPIEADWYYAKRMVGDAITACWSGSGSGGMAPLNAIKKALEEENHTLAEEISKELRYAAKPLFPQGSFKLFSYYTIPLFKAMIDAAGLFEMGPGRPPYTIVPEEYLEGAKEAGLRWARLQEIYSKDIV